MNGYFTVALGVFVVCTLTTATVYGYTQHREAVSQRAAAVAARSELAQYQASAAAVIAERLQEQARQAAINDSRTKEINRANQQKLADITARYNRLRSAASSDTSRMPSESSTDHPSSGTDARDAAGRFADSLERCEQAVARLSALQRWIRETQ